MSFHEQWKKELDTIKLSDNKKENMLRNIQRKEQKKQRNWGYPIVLSMFTVAVLFFVFISLQPNDKMQPTINATDTVTLNPLHVFTITETLYWGVAVVTLAIIALIQLVMVIFKTVRWNHLVFVKTLREYLRMQKRYVLIHTTVINVAAWSLDYWFTMLITYLRWWIGLSSTVSLVLAIFVGATIVSSYMLYIHYKIAREANSSQVIKQIVIYQMSVIGVLVLVSLAVSTVFVTSSPVDTLQIWFALLIMGMYFLWLLWRIRHATLPSCPCCGHVLSKKEIWKMSWKCACSQCGTRLYITKNARNKIDIIFMPAMFIMFPTFGFPRWVMYIGFIIALSFVNFYILPYLTKYSSEDEPLW